MARRRRALGEPGALSAASSSAVTSMLLSWVKGSGENSAVWGLGALAMDSVMPIGSPGCRGG